MMNLEHVTEVARTDWKSAPCRCGGTIEWRRGTEKPHLCRPCKAQYHSRYKRHKDGALQ